ncbi:MAG: ribosome silencing factor [Syntrophomonadaceae bacterium]|nr:ribosome silencing factor [Syntrophomonadaceae bacterium]
MNDSIQLVQWIVEAAGEQKALDLVTLDLRGVSLIADYFVICSGRSTVQVKAIAEHIEKFLENQGIRVLHREGKREGQWLLLDYGSVVVHVFREEERRYYGLERLWADAKLVEDLEEAKEDKGLTFVGP